MKKYLTTEQLAKELAESIQRMTPEESQVAGDYSQGLRRAQMTDQQKKRELIKTYLLVLLNEAKSEPIKTTPTPKLKVFKPSQLIGLAAAAKRVAREEQLFLNVDATGKKPN
jgi:hypothetical protein